MSKKKQLILDDDESIKELSVNHTIKINTKFATEFERRKRLEELHNAKQDFVDSDSDSSSTTSSEEDEDAVLSTPHVDVQILKTLQAIRTKDSSIYDPDKIFFPNENYESTQTNKRKKVKRYKDIVRESILDQMDESSHSSTYSSDAKEDWKEEKHSHMAYNDEQVALRAAFLDSVQADEENNNTTTNNNDDDDDDEEGSDLILLSRKNQDSIPTWDREIQTELETLEKTKSASLVDPRGEVQDGDHFLLDYFKNRRWVDATASSKDRIQDMNEDMSHDSQESMDDLDKTDAFESKYNFRFEEITSSNGVGPQLVGYSRTSLSDTLRRKEDTRKVKREQRREKKLAERKAKEERLKRLKNAKREEMEHRLKKIKGVIRKNWEEGQEDLDENVLLKLLDGEYDADKFDELMSEAFGDQFYEKKEDEWKTDEDIRASYEEYADYVDDAMVENEGDGVFLNEDHEVVDDYENEEETELDKKLDAKMEDELYKLDYEDIIDDLPTRFKYRSVEANNYGLSAEEILLASDSTLKQYVSLKKMAPYVEESYNPGSKRRKRFREMLHNELSSNQKESKDAATASETREVEAVKVKAKKRRQKKRNKKTQAEIKD